MKIFENVRCPKCGGELQENAKAYGCARWRETDGGCKVTIWKKTWGHDVTPSEAGEMFAGRAIGPVEVTLRSGMKKQAKMRYDAGMNKVVLDFADGKGDPVKAENQPIPTESQSIPAEFAFSNTGDWGDPGFSM